MFELCGSGKKEFWCMQVYISCWCLVHIWVEYIGQIYLARCELFNARDGAFARALASLPYRKSQSFTSHTVKIFFQ